MGAAPARYAASPCGPPLRNALTGASPHRITAIDRNSHGIHARVTTDADRRCAPLRLRPARDDGVAVAVEIPDVCAAATRA